MIVLNFSYVEVYSYRLTERINVLYNSIRREYVGKETNEYTRPSMHFTGYLHPTTTDTDEC